MILENWIRVRDHFAGLRPEQVEMCDVLLIKRRNRTVGMAKRPGCGTIGCIAGWTCLALLPETTLVQPDGELYIDGEWVEAWPVARDLLGLKMPDNTLTDDGIGGDEERHVFYAHWHPTKHWESGTITQAEVVAYLTKAIEAGDPMVKLTGAEVEALELAECQGGRQ